MLPNRVAAALLAALILGPLPAVAQGGCAEDLALIRLDDSQVLEFDIEVVDTPASRAQGLMYRKDVPPGTGMLFIYEQPQPVSFWMRNTLVPLDMIFLDAEGVIRHIHPNARPLDETPVPGAMVGDPDPARLMVLEIAGGEAARLGLAKGQVLAHPALDQDRAAFPCN